MSTVLAVLVDGIIYSSWLFIVAAGLTLIYGVMRILNMAHGSLYALGAYAAASLTGAAARRLGAHGQLRGAGARRCSSRWWWGRSSSAACCASATAGTRWCWCSSPTPCS